MILYDVWVVHVCMYGYMDIGMSVYCKCLCIDTAGMYIMYIRMQMHARLAEVSGSFTGSPISYLVTDNLWSEWPMAKHGQTNAIKYKHVIEMSNNIGLEQCHAWKNKLSEFPIPSCFDQCPRHEIAVTCRYCNEDLGASIGRNGNQCKYAMMLHGALR